MNLFDLPCVAEGCDRKIKIVAHELCNRCYLRRYKSDSLRVLVTCEIDECSSVESFRGFCMKHRGEGNPGVQFPRKSGKWVSSDGARIHCSEAGCDKPAHCRSLCRMHYSRLQREESGYVRTSVKRTQEDGTPLKCLSEGCETAMKALGLCESHYREKRYLEKSGGVPSFDTCPTRLCGRNKIGAHRVCKRCAKYGWRYSLSVEDIIKWHLPENYRCSNPGCGSVENLHIDHDHSCCDNNPSSGGHKVSCGECVRGWLCHTCNTSLGMLQENPRRIQGLLDYLTLHEDHEASS